MDGRDSSPATAAAVEDDRIPPVTDGLAREAAVLFSSQRFAECVDVLNQLLLKKERDPKVLHNIAVAECFRDGCSDPRKLLDMLNEVKRKSEELALSSREQADSSGSLGSNSDSGSKGSSTNSHQLSATDTSNVAYIDEFDTSIITLNTAIVLYHLHEYAQALSILEPLYQNIYLMDEATALHVCLLLLDVSFASQDASKAAEVIQYLEKYFGDIYSVNQSDNIVNPTQYQSLIQGTKASTVSSNSAPEPTNSDINDIPLSGTLADDLYETFLSTLDGSSQNLGRPPSSDLAKASLQHASELKLKMHLYKVRLLLLTRNSKAAKREVKFAMNMARGRDSSTELLLKSQVEYARGNHRKAIKLLNTASSRTDPRMLSIFNNNFGCIHYQLRSHHTSGLFFSQALKSSLSFLSEKPMRLSKFSQDKSLLIVYNCGVQHLACGKPLVAAKCFGKASLVFYNQPLLWVRIAESCLLASEKGILKSSGEGIRVHVAGTGRWRQLVVDDLSAKKGYDNGENGDQCELSLPFARYCLQNALLLLTKKELNVSKSSAPVITIEEEDSIKSPNHKSASAGDSKAPNMNSNGDSKENKGILSSHLTLKNSVAAYEETQRKKNHMIKQAVLGALAYTELSLENPVKALSSAKLLLEVPECSKIYLFLGRIYAAEALCHLNRFKEAAEYLSVYFTDAGIVDLPSSNEDKDKWYVEKGGSSDYEDVNSLPQESQGSMLLKPEEAVGVVLLNFSAVLAMQGDHEKASKYASEAQSLLPKEPRALLSSVYIDLLQERRQEALSKLKKFNHVTYLWTDVKFSS